MKSESEVPSGAIPSPNIWEHTSTYELENSAADPHGYLWAAMQKACGPGDWRGRDVLDLGCGTGFHLPLFAERAHQVIGVEPHPELVNLARRRVKKLTNVAVYQGLAQEIPLPAKSVDVVHARWAYFFGPGSEAGLAEISRVLRRGGTALIIDNDATTSTFGRWFSRGYPMVEPVAVETFFSLHGFRRVPVEMGWRFETHQDFEDVLRIEFTPELAAEFIAEYDAIHNLNASGRTPVGGIVVDYAVNLWVKQF